MHQKEERARRVIDNRPVGKHALTTIYEYDTKVDYAEVVAGIMKELIINYTTIDAGLYELLSEAPHILAEVMEKELNPAVVFNTINTPFGKGLLLGMVSDALVQRYNDEADEKEANSDGQ